MAVKKKKERPSYNILQNSAYVLGRAWRTDKAVVFVILLQIVLTVAISTVALFLPRTVVAQIIGGADAFALVTTVAGFTAVTLALQTLKSYIDSVAQGPRIFQRIHIQLERLAKILTTDYANLEQKAFTDLNQKVSDASNSNNTSSEQIFFTFASFGGNLLGFAVYLALLIAVNPLVLLLTAAAAVAGALAGMRADKWRHDHDGERAGYGKRVWYITQQGKSDELAKDIRLFAMTDWLRDVYAANMRMLYDFHRRVEIRRLAADAADCVCAFCREGLAYAYLIYLVLYAGLPVEQFVLLFAAIGGFSGWITGILNDLITLNKNSLDFCRVREFFGYPDAFKRAGGEPLTAEPGRPYALELRGVSFRYAGAEENTLENIDLSIKPGEKLAVVGLNGAGKTTLVKLLCGFYDPTEGQVLLNGKDIRGFDRVQYYGLFTAVFQEFNILPVTVAENVAQRTGDEIDRERLDYCLKLAGLDEKIKTLPQGADTLMVRSVHEDAAELSGGETQRLVLARALYKDSPVMILDEPTAALDPIAESALYERYNELSAGKTSVYISHRLASTRFCDRVLLISGKGIAEQGSHDELMARGGRYAELFEIQRKYYQEHEMIEEGVESL